MAHSTRHVQLEPPAVGGQVDLLLFAEDSTACAPSTSSWSGRPLPNKRLKLTGALSAKGNR